MIIKITLDVDMTIRITPDADMIIKITLDVDMTIRITLDADMPLTITLVADMTIKITLDACIVSSHISYWFIFLRNFILDMTIILSQHIPPPFLPRVISNLNSKTK